MSIGTKQMRLFARQPLPVAGKIAFWAAVVGSLAGIGGVIALTIASGAPSRDVVLATVCWLVIVALLASRLRWGPVVTTLVGAYNLYLAATEPYAVASLTSPKGPDGGIGKYIGVVIILGCALLVLGGSIVAAVQNYRKTGPQAPRWFPAALTLVAGMVIGAIFTGAISQPAAPAGTTYTNGVPTIHMNATQFDETSVTISKGSKLMLVDDTPVVHILANGSWQNGTPRTARETGAPPISNVQLNGNSVEVGPFAAAGTYHIYCEVHQGMNLTVIVQ